MIGESVRAFEHDEAMWEPELGERAATILALGENGTAWFVTVGIPTKHSEERKGVAE